MEFWKEEKEGKDTNEVSRGEHTNTNLTDAGHQVAEASSGKRNAVRPYTHRT